MVGSEGGWGVPVQPVRQAGELGVEGSNRAEVQSHLNTDYGARQIPLNELAVTGVRDKSFQALFHGLTEQFRRYDR